MNEGDKMGTLGTDNGADPGGYAYRDQESLKVLLYSSHPLVIKGIKGMLADVLASTRSAMQPTGSRRC